MNSDIAEQVARLIEEVFKAEEQVSPSTIARFFRKIGSALMCNQSHNEYKESLSDLKKQNVAILNDSENTPIENLFDDYEEKLALSSGMITRCVRSLQREGILSLECLSTMNTDSFNSIPNIGPDSIAVIKFIMDKKGFNIDFGKRNIPQLKRKIHYYARVFEGKSPWN